MPIVRDMLRHGEIKWIKEVMEVPIAQLGASHATNLGTKHKTVGMI